MIHNPNAWLLLFFIFDSPFASCCPLVRMFATYHRVPTTVFPKVTPLSLKLSTTK